jgi:UDP-glucose 4-epimerase
MKVLVTGSSGHLGEALVRTLVQQPGIDVIGLDCKSSPTTHAVGLVTDRSLVSRLMPGVDVVYHTATLHKPHVATHSAQDFVDTNITGTLVLLEAAAAERVPSFVFTSTTSVYGDALQASVGGPAVWVTEDTVPIAKNIYGVTKLAAENLCHLFHRRHGLNCIVLRTSRFFPEEDDDRAKRERFSENNLKAIEFLYRRVEIEDVVSAHELAAKHCGDIGFGRYIISAVTPFHRGDITALNGQASGVLAERIPHYRDSFGNLGWQMLEQVDRVYDSSAAQRSLGWRPRHNFVDVLARVAGGGELLSELARAIGAKGYHGEVLEDGPYPV